MATANGNGAAAAAAPATATAPAADAAAPATATAPAAATAADVKTVPDATLEARITEILKTADMSTFTIRILREQLEREFKVDLKPRREWLTQTLDKVLRAPAPAAAPAVKEEPKKEVSQEEKDRLMAEELAQEERRPRRGAASESYRKADKRKQKEEKAAEDKAKPARKKRPPKTFQLTPAMAAFVGTDRMTRGDVTKAIWKYIKEHNLQVENDKRKITCDDKLKTIFGKDRKTIDMFKMTKVVATHICKDGELVHQSDGDDE